MMAGARRSSRRIITKAIDRSVSGLMIRLTATTAGPSKRIRSSPRYGTAHAQAFNWMKHEEFVLTRNHAKPSSHAAGAQNRFRHEQLLVEWDTQRFLAADRGGEFRQIGLVTAIRRQRHLLRAFAVRADGIAQI